MCTGENFTHDLSTAKTSTVISVNIETCVDCSNNSEEIFDALPAANKSKGDVSIIKFTCSYCKTVSHTLGELRNDLQTLKNDIHKRIDDITMEIKTHLDNKLLKIISLRNKVLPIFLINAKYQ